jgi:flavin reductase (DIM6/NTAB) family NADH-FMN oxidoreductase RutF
LAAQAFSLSWIDSKFAKAVESLGTRSAATFRDKLAAGGLTHKWGVILRVPVVVEASAVLECSLAEIHKLGDHDLLVGDIRNAYASSDFSEYWKFKQYHPMLYVGSERGFQVRSMEAKATREASSPR